MTDKQDKDRLDALKDRLDKAQTSTGRNNNKPPPKGNKNLGKAYRIGFELILAVAIGGAIGWYLDKWLETTPWLFVIFFFLGVAAGFRNVYKAAQRMGDD